MSAQPTIHFAVARFVRRFYPNLDAEVIAARDDPVSRRRALYVIDAAWGLIGFGFVVAMLVIGVPVRILVGEEAGNAVVFTLFGASLFCIAGCAHVLRRWYWYLPKARRRLAAADHAGYETFMARALPRNSSIVFQAAVGILTVLAAAGWL